MGEEVGEEEYEIKKGCRAYRKRRVGTYNREEEERMIV